MEAHNSSSTFEEKKEEIMFKGLSIQKKSVLCVFHVSIKLQK